MGRMETNSRKKNPFLIGLTGTIGTGKSLVLAMLRHLGALTLDADWLACQSYHKGRPGHAAILAHFGEEMAAPDGEIDREILGRMVFSSMEKLAKLESLIHPIVTDAITEILQQPPLPIIAVEAIKLFESDLAGLCDNIWILNAEKKTVFQRLRETRGMSDSEIEDRMRHQSGILDNMEKADMVIENNADVYALWKSVSKKWNYLKENNLQFKESNQAVEYALSPFNQHLLRPSRKNAEHISSYIKEEQLDFFRNIRFPRKKTVLDREDIFLMLCAYINWQFNNQGDHEVFLSFRMKHQCVDLIAASPLKNLPADEIQHMMRIIENYCRLHLCVEIKLLYKGKEAVLEQIGYLKNKPEVPGGESVGARHEYNIYTKSLSP